MLSVEEVGSDGFWKSVFLGNSILNLGIKIIHVKNDIEKLFIRRPKLSKFSLVCPISFDKI
jgi:hypothetical protein